MKKLLSVLLCLSFLLTAVACKKETPQEPETPSVYATYDDVVAEFTKLLTAKQSGEELDALNTENMDERETAIAEALYGIADFYEKKPDLIKYLGYGYKDMDGNGVSELFLLTDSSIIYAIFTLSDGKPILLESSCDLSTSYCKFAGGDRFFLTRDSVTDHIEEANYYTFRIEGDHLVYDLAYGAIYDQENKTVLEYFQTVDGNRVTIDKETFEELYWEYERTTTATFTGLGCKLSAPYIHFPFRESIDTAGLPVADFSSYDAILSTCQAMNTQIEEYKHRDWISGKYDNLFSFQNETDFAYYSYLLYTGVAGNDYKIGYDLIDLNGDGQDELVLLFEDFRIRAIFTQKEGVPVLLNFLSVVDIATYDCWLDDQGFLRIDRMDNDLLGFDTYELTKNGDFRLKSSILMTEHGRYLTRDGKTEKISREEYLELYNDYYCYAEYFDSKEYTKEVSDLTYTPLTQPTEDLVQSATAKVWSTHDDREETTGKHGAHSTTYMTFENVTDTQMDVSFKYEFTYYYPDPDHVSTVPGVIYTLPDTTESFLKVTARKENGVFVFDENGIKGRIEFGQDYQWLIIEESTDERFHVGPYCFGEYDSSTIIS